VIWLRQAIFAPAAHMSRIRKAYRTQFQDLLASVRARRIDAGVQWLENKARLIARSGGIPIDVALSRVQSELRVRLGLHPRCAAQGGLPGASPKLLCDAGLGGLARWLRAAGYEALWKPELDDPELVLEARRISAILLTTDSMLMERRMVRQGTVVALWLPPSMNIQEQLKFFLSEFGFHILEPRCMSCAGKLRPVDKESVRDRIPPKTYRWLSEFFLCASCDKLFWRGTHWQNIETNLKSAVSCGNTG
jgi:uncharacterized protein